MLIISVLTIVFNLILTGIFVIWVENSHAALITWSKQEKPKLSINRKTLEGISR